MATSEYEKKRDFDKTPEPEQGGSPSARPIFVIQEHQASTHHYDFRIEAGDALKSWSVPKGPSTDPQDKRLAVPTEDHPLAYADFEGVIPEGEYGAGTVMVWDRGTYENVTEKDGETVPVTEALANGHLLICLYGEKLKGGYALQRIGSGDDERWLLIKMDDDHADARRDPVATENRSVISGRTLQEIAREDQGG